MFKKKDTYLKLIFLVYLLFSIVLIWHHELWRDELHSWNIANYSNSIGQLYENIRLEGHPILWYLVLYVFKSIGFSYLVIPYINLFFAALALFLFLFYSPFNLLQKWLFPFGVIFGYEYSIIARNYAICIPFFFLFCVLYNYSKSRSIRILMTILLFFAMNTSIFASFVAIGIFCAFGGKLTEYKINLNERISHILIVLSGVTLSILPIYNNYISIYSVQQIEQPRKLLVVHKYLNTIFASNLWLAVAISSVLIICLLFIYRKKLSSIFYYLVAGLTIGSVLIATFWALVHATEVRHFGFLFLLFVTIYWIFLIEKKDLLPKISNYLSPIFSFLLIIQIPFYMHASFKDITQKFSNNAAVLEFINKNKLQNSILIGNRKYLVESFGAMLNKKFYTFDDTASIDFVRWETHMGLKFFDQENLTKIGENQQKDALLIMELNPVYTDSLLKKNDRLKFLATFDRAFRTHENYNLYYFKRK